MRFIIEYKYCKYLVCQKSDSPIKLLQYQLGRIHCWANGQGLTKYVQTGFTR